MTAPPAPTTLFSLQVAVDTLSFRPPHALGSASPPQPFVLAFQLLQLDIVLLEATASTLQARDGVVELRVNAAADDDDDSSNTGAAQSCLFESDAQQLALDLERDADAAFVWLVLQREDHRARLVAFACVPLELPHLAFTGDGKAPRVSEWASVDATWPLVDQQHASLGSVGGRITLACLGRALAPHVVARPCETGVLRVLATTSSTRPLDRSVGSSSPVALAAQEETDDGTGGRRSNLAEATSSSRTTAKHAKAASESPQKLHGEVTSTPTTLKPEERRDAAIQCSDPDDDDDEGQHGSGYPKPILIRGSSTSNRSSRVRTAPSNRIVDELDRLRLRATASSSRQKTTETTRSSRRDHTHSRVRYSNAHEQFPRERPPQHDTSFVESQLPPPLFFHKPRQPKQPQQH